MSKKAKVAALVEKCRGGELDAHYLAYFECFNAGHYFEAHDVLEPLWLAGRDAPNHYFYKGLIQLAGAFVHLQKNRLRPAAAVFKLAEQNLKKFPAFYEHLDVSRALQVAASVRELLEQSDFQANPLGTITRPSLELDRNNPAPATKSLQSI